MGRNNKIGFQDVEADLLSKLNFAPVSKKNPPNRREFSGISWQADGPACSG